MSSGRSNVTRKSLERDLMKIGLSKRESQVLLSSIFSAIVSALLNHEEVELPGIGTLYLKKNPQPFRFFFRGTIAERFRSKYTVAFREEASDEQQGRDVP